MNTPFAETGSLVLVDNDAEDALILYNAVRRCTHEVPIVHLAAGEDLLEAVRAASLPTRCVVLLDLNMPTMDGFAVLKQLRLGPDRALLPVVIYTTSSDQIQIDRAYAAGANAFLTKPASMHEMIELVDAVISHWLTFGKTPSSKTPSVKTPSATTRTSTRLS